MNQKISLVLIKRLLIFVFCLATTNFTHAQYSQDFESSTLTPIVRAGTDAQATAVNASNPVTSGINTSATAFQITLTDTAPGWRWIAINNPGGTYGSANGTFYKFKFFSANETSVNIQLEPWFSSIRYITEVQTFTVSLNTWYEVEFDFSNALLQSDGVTAAGAEPGYLSRLDFKFNATGTYDGDIYYIDDILQLSSSTLSIEDISLRHIKMYPNPTTGKIFISDLKDVETITIHNVLGQELKSFSALDSIDISDLSKGIYFLQSNNGLNRKIIKN
ncbi:T9SS type A sorting domain-containing protein [uncultured Lutibacter sp.]|uniref:T9SS type A sorting domain-containing protein n=1 Tax=uncultured Lutibacter sp. TaxID=437739 RepID=UPI002633F6F7|nr:T9SS type A sorting domain-containing protein [uncultured Lutibacter sp.]